MDMPNGWGKGHTGQPSIKTIGDRESWEREEVVLPRVFSAKWPSPEDMHAGGIIRTEQVIFRTVWIYYIHICIYIFMQ